MKLSVIVPVYNSEKYLDRCLNSIIKQNIKNMEIILINDGSTDNSENVIKRYKKEYPTLIKNIKQNNKGQAYSRNIGLNLAKGDFITFVDSDDYINENMYKKMIDLIEKDDSDLAICDICLEKNNSRTIISATDFDSLFNCSVSVCNKVFKREFIINERFVEKIWYEDYNFFIKLCLKNPTYSLCKEPLYNYVVHNNSTMNNNNTIKNLDIIKATDDILLHKIDKNLKDNLIIDHILLETINRVHKQKSKDKKKVLKTLNTYIHNNIKSIFKTQNYKNSSLKRKIILTLNYYNLGSVSKYLLQAKEVMNNAKSINNSSSL